MSIRAYYNGKEIALPPSTPFLGEGQVATTRIPSAVDAIRAGKWITVNGERRRVLSVTHRPPTAEEAAESEYGIEYMADVVLSEPQ